MDATEANPYRLHWSQDAKFVETEERYLRWARQAAAPRPWFWFPETWEVNHRILEPEELRLLTCVAIGQGVKGISYYSHTYGKPPVNGFDKSPRLVAEIKALNRMFKKYERIFSTAIPISEANIGSDGDGACVRTLWSGDPAGVLVAVRNLDYTSDREPNGLGSKPRFRHNLKKEPVQIRIAKPAWMKVRASPPGLAVNAIDLISGQRLRCNMNAQEISFDVDLDLARLIFIPS